jgi:hypothetical protein
MHAGCSLVLHQLRRNHVPAPRSDVNGAVWQGASLLEAAVGRPPHASGASNARFLPKAALKSPHSKRWRDLPASSNLAKRLDCVRFTAAFALPCRQLLGADAARTVVDAKASRL